VLVPKYSLAATYIDERRLSRVFFPLGRKEGFLGDDHPSLETMARWLAGELDHEAVLRELAPHLSGSCAACRRNQEDIERLKEECGHWSETVAVFETREAPELARRFEGLSHKKRMRLVENDEDLQTWGLCQYLLVKTRKAWFEDPLGAIETARLAVRIAEHLGDSYHPDWVLELRARAHAYLGNALRVVGELKSADHEFLMADECLEPGAGCARVQAEVLSLKGSLRLDQRRFDESRSLLEQALRIYRDTGHTDGVAATLLKMAKLVKADGDLESSILLLHESLREIDPISQARLYAYALQSLLTSLTLSGRNQDAENLLPRVNAHFRSAAGPLDWLRLRWTEGSIAQGLGRTDEAEAAYREVRERFLELGKSYDAALVSLDLATIYAERGEREALKRIAAEILPVFQARDVHREALAALLLFHQACAEERATVEMIRQVTGILSRTGKAAVNDVP
jgi:tetratricopeptide (TPR) repeat protein